MAINTGVRRASLVGACLLLLAACAGAAAVEGRFEADCKAMEHPAGSDQLPVLTQSRPAGDTVHRKKAASLTY